MDGTLDAWDILRNQKEAVLSVKVKHFLTQGEQTDNLIYYSE
jgi:hypothetical protein